MTDAQITKRLSLSLVAAALTTTLATGAVQAADLTISISDIKTAEGKLMLNLVNSEAQMGDTADGYASLMLTPSTDGVSITMHNLPAGTYGVQLFHDENNNGELDANMLGIPKEPYAFSNNAAGRFGPPKWKDIKFEISAEDAAVMQNISFNP